MTALRPMTPAEFLRWRAQTTPSYAADKVRVGRWSEEAALAEAEKELSTLLPDGLLSAGHVFFTIESGPGASVGAVWVARAERAFGPIGYVYDLVVWPEHRGQGHGEGAMQALEAEAVKLGFHGLALHVFGHNHPARSLYAKLGYLPTNLNLFKPLHGLDEGSPPG